MALARRPAAYLPPAGPAPAPAPGTGGAGSPQAMARAARRRGWPAPVIYAEGDPDPAGQPGAALARLEAAIESGRHDALLLPLPPTLRDPAALMRLLSRCTQHGVAVGLVLPSAPEPGLTVRPAGPPARDPAGLLARARLDALAEIYPGWRIWLDSHGWHARRRDDGFLQGYRSGAQAFCVHAGSAPGLAAQLSWQQAATAHAPGGCSTTLRPPPPWGHRVRPPGLPQPGLPQPGLPQPASAGPAMP
jgi:hypothetical protein